jgi:DNA-binding response OmpR family regulator
MARVRSVLRRRTGESESTFTVGDFRVDPERFAFAYAVWTFSSRGRSSLESDLSRP